MNTLVSPTASDRDAAKPQPRSIPMTTAASPEPIEILLVEDNPDEAYLTINALREGRVRNRVTLVGDGVEAMAYLRREGKYAQAPRPHLILLDLYMPRKDGREVLAEVKQDPELKHIPVVMMTNSREQQDILAAYNLHVNCYVTKPVDVGQLIQVVRTIEHFWLCVVTLAA
jgi:chemotaxis family two-component system response regulator Rcp1